MTPTRQEMRLVTEQRVITAAATLFRERGFAATTVRDIAKSSGVSIGTVMAVGDKSTLLVRVFDSLVGDEHRRRTETGTPAANGRAWDRIAHSTDEQAPGAGREPGTSCADGILALVRPFVTILTRWQDLARTFAGIVASGNHSSSLFTDLADTLIDEFEAAVTEHGCTRPGTGRATAEALYFAYIGTLFSWSARRASDPRELEAGLHRTFTAICTCPEDSHAARS